MGLMKEGDSSRCRGPAKLPEPWLLSPSLEPLVFAPAPGHTNVLSTFYLPQAHSTHCMMGRRLSPSQVAARQSYGACCAAGWRLVNMKEKKWEVP